MLPNITTNKGISYLLLTLFLFVSNHIQLTAQNTEFEVAGPLQAAYTYEVNCMEVLFQNTSEDAIYVFWEFGDGDTTTFGSPVHVYEVPGTYSVTLTAHNTIGQTASITHEITVDYCPGINNDNAGVTNDEMIVQYAHCPNPVDSYLEFTFEGLRPQDHNSLSIFNIAGQQVKYIDHPQEQLTVEVQDLPEGLYLYLLQNADGKTLVMDRFAVAR